jgi:hypothetical protein
MIAGTDLLSYDYMQKLLSRIIRSALIGVKVTFIWFGKILCRCSPSECIFLLFSTIIPLS